MIKKYKARPIEIEAVKWESSIEPIRQFLKDKTDSFSIRPHYRDKNAVWITVNKGYNDYDFITLYHSDYLVQYKGDKNIYPVQAKEIENNTRYEEII